MDELVTRLDVANKAYRENYWQQHQQLHHQHQSAVTAELHTQVTALHTAIAQQTQLITRVVELLLRCGDPPAAPAAPAAPNPHLIAEQKKLCDIVASTAGVQSEEYRRVAAVLEQLNRSDACVLHK